MIFARSNNIFTKIIKLAIFWFALIACFVLMVALYEYEIKKPSQEISIEIDVQNQINICKPDPIIERKFYEGFWSN